MAAAEKALEDQDALEKETYQPVVSDIINLGADLQATIDSGRTVTPERLIKARDLYNSLPTEFQRFGNFTLKGITTITPDEINATLNVRSQIGTIISDLQLTNVSNIDNAAYSGEVEFVDFNVGKFFNDPLLGEISFKGDVNGSGFMLENIKTAIIGKFSKLEFKDYQYKNIVVNGQYQNNLFDGDLLVNDDNLKLEFKGLADLSSEIHEFDFKANIEFADLREINLFTRDTVSLLKGKVISFLFCTTYLAKGTVKSYRSAFSDREFEKAASLFCANASKFAFFSLSPEFRILKIKRSPSSPYFPSNVEVFSNDGVSIGSNP